MICVRFNNIFLVLFSVDLLTSLLVLLFTCSLVDFLLFQDKKKVDMKSGKTAGLSGKEMFMFNPSIINQATEDGDDEEGGDFDLNMREKDDDNGVKVGLTKSDCCFVIIIKIYSHTKMYLNILMV